ncbi:MAG: 16S rRNA (guanine(966)-N(2))-methyltransferase RsmD [Rhodanobacteraceae bacterium]
MKRVHPAKPPGTVRIVGGSLRGSKLAVPALPGLRPTPQRLRETLFNWLMPVIEGARVLDLFAGSGALGIEAVSRGAGSVLLVERDRAQAQKIIADLERLHVSNAEVQCVDALELLAKAPARPFGIVFLDPPFESGFWSRAADLLDANGWLAPDTYIYIESPGNVVPVLPPRWALHRETRAGGVRGALHRVG